MAKYLFVFANECDHDSLYDKFGSGDQFGIFRVFSAQVRFVLFGEERLERAFVINERRHNVAGFGSETMLKDCVIPRQNVFPDHRVTTDLQGKCARGGTDAEAVDVDRDAAIGFLFSFLGIAGGDGAVNGDVHDEAAQFHQRRDNLPGTGLARLVFEHAFVDQSADMIDRGRHAVEAEMAGDLAQAGRLTGGLLLGLDELQNLTLTFGKLHTVQMNSIRFRSACQQS
jgi:hypothetical protein